MSINGKPAVNEKIAKYIHKELTKLRNSVVKDIKIREKMALTCNTQKEFLTRKDFINPKYALRKLDSMIFSFEYEIRSRDNDWIRCKLIHNALSEAGFNPEGYNEDRKAVNKILIPIERKLYKKRDKGMKLFAKHFSDLFTLEYYSLKNP